MKHESFVKGITDILCKRNVISKEEAAALAEAFKGSAKPYFDDFLLDEGIINKDDLLPALAEYFEVPFFDAVGYFFNHEMLHMFPKNFLWMRGIIPIERDENMLIMLASNPKYSNLLPDIGDHVSYDIRFRVGIRQDILNAIEEFYEQALTEVNPDFDEDYDETRQMREGEIRKEKEVEELSYEDYEKKE